MPGTTINRLCGSGMDAVGQAARAIRAGDCDLMIAGGVESMTRAPFVMPKAESAFSRSNAVYDTTIGWRFVNPKMKKDFGVDSMPETADNVAADFGVSRADQDAFAARSQARWAAAQEAGRFARRDRARDDPAEEGRPDRRRQPTSIRAPAPPPRRWPSSRASTAPTSRVTAGNASGVNDGAAALVVASEAAAKRARPDAEGARRRHGRRRRRRRGSWASARRRPRAGCWSAPGSRIDQMDVIELNEAFAAQALAVLRDLGLPDDAAHVNPNGGAIALGHPLGMSGARLVTTAMYELHRRGGRYALCTMCIGVGQGIAAIIERV